MQVWFGDLIFGTFCLISRDPVHIFQNRSLRWNRGFKPVVLNTINPIIGRIFFRTYIGVPEFKNIKKIAVRVLQMKIWNIPHVQYIKWFHFFTTRNKFSRKMYFHLNLTRPTTVPVMTWLRSWDLKWYIVKGRKTRLIMMS